MKGSDALMPQEKDFDVAVIGAGVFGSWTAHALAHSGAKVALLDAYGPANSRASSGGESRIIRMGYGSDELYTRWSMRSLPIWKELFARTRRPELFQPTGVLWMARENERHAHETASTFARLGVAFEKLSHAELEKRFPQISLTDIAWGIFEPESGVLMARRAVQVVIAEAVRTGVEYFAEAAAGPTGSGRLDGIALASGRRISAEKFVFACGPWLGKIFPNILNDRIFPSRQEVFFFGIPAGNLRFAPPAFPTWLNLGDEMYGMPDLEGRGLKIAHDRHGPRVDPDTQSRLPSAEALRFAQDYLARRFPALKDAPVVESRVCQYENTSNGDFLVDRHPDFENVWLVGGGSGHGFKHGPAIGEYVAGLLAGTMAAEPRFSLASKKSQQHRAVF
ncbi:MAG: FAD-dependent oxidoreductase [Candidatus Acidiferrales bacterium]